MNSPASKARRLVQVAEVLADNFTHDAECYRDAIAVGRVIVENPDARDADQLLEVLQATVGDMYATLAVDGPRMTPRRRPEPVVPVQRARAAAYAVLDAHRMYRESRADTTVPQAPDETRHSVRAAIGGLDAPGNTGGVGDAIDNLAKALLSFIEASRRG